MIHKKCLLKSDIYSIEQLATYRSRGLPIPADTRISITLLDKIDALEHSDALRERILLPFSADRCTFKRTYKNRFDAFDRKALEIIAASPNEPLLIHDMGVSDASTACDFYQALKGASHAVDYFASDYTPDILVIDDKITLSPDGALLEIIVPPFVFGGWRESRFYPINNLIRRLVWHVYAPYLLKQYRAKDAPNQRTVRLFCPRALALASQDEHFHLLKHNIFDASPLPYKATIIRAMNILNPSYFSAEKIALALTHIHHALADGGIFITGSNQDAGTLVNGGIYRKTERGFSEIWRSGEGPPFGNDLTQCIVAT